MVFGYPDGFQKWGLNFVQFGQNFRFGLFTLFSRIWTKKDPLMRENFRL